VDTVTVERIDALLPQTQCARCGYGGCRPYAEAISRSEADINRCPPGGQAGIDRLAALLGRPAGTLDPACGEEEPPTAAVIDEAACIGCTLCIQACPVDAIVGTARRMHTVLLDECTGCSLCIPPCPVDCIALKSVADLQDAGFDLASRPPGEWRIRAERARSRWSARGARLAQEKQEQEQRLAEKARSKLASLTAPDPETARKRAIVAAAIDRARERRRRESTE